VTPRGPFHPPPCWDSVISPLQPAPASTRSRTRGRGLTHRGAVGLSQPLSAGRILQPQPLREPQSHHVPPCPLSPSAAMGGSGLGPSCGRRAVAVPWVSPHSIFLSIFSTACRDVPHALVMSHRGAQGDPAPFTGSTVALPDPLPRC